MEPLIGRSKMIDASKLQNLQNCERRIGYEFQEMQLLDEAMTHASSSISRLHSYERLEFLGDSILGFVVCEFLFRCYPNWLEGELTKVKSVVVSRQACAKLGQELGLSEFLVIGKGIGKRETIPDSLLANAFEALLGAIYLDGGMAAAKDFLLPFVEELVQMTLDENAESNFKSDLQQYAQKRDGLPPAYQLLGDRGPDHEKWFMVAATIGKRKFAPAWGRNKKEAEQRAAANALAEIHGNDLPYEHDLDTVFGHDNRPVE
jgi:ribonuclease-3